MFIKTENKEMLIEELQKKLGENVVIHYNCEKCDDEQVTYEDEITEEMIESFKKNGYIMVRLSCTNCGETTLFLSIDYIQGMENDF